MALPKSIDIYGQKWTIKVTTELPPHYAGMCVKPEKELLINKDQDKNEVMPTLLHECFHVLFNRIGLDQSVNPDVEEIIVENLSQWLCETFEIKKKK